MYHKIINYTALTILTLAWIAFGFALFTNPQLLDAVWESFRDLHLVFQLVIGLFFLPIVIGLWAWESSLPLTARYLIVLGLALATIYMFIPKKAPKKPDDTPVVSQPENE